MIVLGPRRIQEDEDIQQMIMEANYSIKNKKVKKMT